ncbi:MAG: hypothetical protein GF353_25535 [Candidatus Lokiarchaeota archaeon]|nr:hypothetical protein [Candidatus Lokiarchaeota archaeon]
MRYYFIYRVLRDVFKHNLEAVIGFKHKLLSDEVHLDAAVKWLTMTIEKSNHNGSLKAYNFFRGWMRPYPETSGYIILTLLDLFKHYNNPLYLELAKDIGDWEISIQREDGGFVGRELGYKDSPIVFNTGQILLGLTYLFEMTTEDKYEKACKKASDFLISCMDSNGCFVKYLHSDIVHSYNVRVAWALLKFGLLRSDDKIVNSALENIEWTLEQQINNGYFENNSFYKDSYANTHTVGYVLRGLLESHLLTKNQKYLDCVQLATERIILKYGIHRKLGCDIDRKWKNVSKHICLTGYAQLAIVLLKTYQLNNDLRYLNTALHLIDDVKSHQVLNARFKDYNGAIPGSFPIYGRYAPMQLPNWATKFFIDALLLKMKVLESYENSIND